MTSRCMVLGEPKRQFGSRRFWSLSLLGLALACGGGSSSGDKADEEPAETRPHESAEQCDDGDDNDDDGFTDCDDLDCRAESDDCPFAPQPDRSIVSNLSETSKFFYTGPDPVQKDFDEEALDFWRTSLIHGSVVNADGGPLRDVHVSVKDHPEYGFTETRFDGRYDLVVNGGGVIVLDFQHEGHIQAQRSVATEWQREHVATEVGLIAKSEQRHRVTVGSGDVVQAEAIEDDYGRRQPFLVFPEWLEAEAVLPNGDSESLGELSLRVTQYPFEPTTPTAPNGGTRFAPGSLPTRGGFNYSIDVSVEEAEELEATSVRFSEPVAYYVENFLRLPTGSPVPLRSYDPSTSEWETMGSGVVVEVVDIQAGLAQLDIDGDGDADDADALEALGVFRQEREELARRFEPGDTLLRNRVTHFSTLTQIWEVLAGGVSAPPDLPFALKQQVDEPLERNTVLVDERVMREKVGLVGTPYSLVYQGDRSNGHTAAFRVQVPLVGDVVPPGLTDVFVVADIAGRLFPEDAAERRLTPQAGLTHEFSWDGKNSSGQLLQGEQTAKVWIGYGFQGASVSGLETLTPEEVENALPFSLPSTVLWSWQDVLLGMLDTQGFQLGGFGLDVHHAFDPVRNILYYGDGRQRTADGLHMQIVALDQPAAGGAGDTVRELDAPDSMAVADDGSVFVSDDGEAGRIWRISPAGDKEVVLGPGASGAAGSIRLLGPQGVALDPTDGTLFVVDWEGLKVVFLRPNGSVGVLLGDDPDALIQEPLSDPDGIAVGPNRELYISDANRVLQVNVSAGNLADPHYVGGVGVGAGIEVLPVMHAKEVPLEQASGLAVDLDTGSLYVASRETHQVWRVEPNGEAYLVAGTGEPGFSGDTELAVDAQLHGPRGVALGRDGSLFISDQENFRIRRVFPSGEIVTVAGGGSDFPGSATPGPNALVNRPDGLAFGPNGSLFAGGGVLDTEPAHLFRLSSTALGLVGATDFVVPSEDGRVAFRFDQNGRHRETIDVITGVTRLTFDYDSNNFLTSVRDNFGVATTINRDSASRADSITGPFGHESALDYHGDGALRSLTVALDGTDTVRESRFAYDDATGLLSEVDRGTGDVTSYSFDSLGRIETVTNPLGQVETYQTEDLLATRRVSVDVEASDSDIYDRSLLSASLYDEFSYNDQDENALNGTELLDRSFSSNNTGVNLSGVMSASAQWGPQVVTPGTTTLTTLDGKQITQVRSESATGLTVTPGGVVVDPLDFDTYEEHVEVGGVRYEQVYDRASKTLTYVSPEGRTTVTQFNDAGLPERVQTAGLADRIFSYDDMGRIATLTLEASGETRVTRYEYGADGKLERVIDPLDQTVEYEYDAGGRNTVIIRNDGTSTRFGYDTNNNLTLLTPPGRPDHLFAYDQGVRLSDYFPPDVGSASGGFGVGQVNYSFDASERPGVATLSDGSTIENHYYQDFYAASQVWVSDAGDSPDVYYLTYDERDKTLLKSVFGPTNGIIYEYDPPLQTSIEFQTQSASGIIRFQYDDLLRVSQLRLVGSPPVDYTYDADSLPIQVGQLSITRDPEHGAVTGTALGAVTTTSVPSPFGELDELHASFASDRLFSQSFERDKLGRVTSITEVNQGETTTLEYTYDMVGRLESATVDGNTERYFYDDAGNRFPDAALAGASYDDQDRTEAFDTWTYETAANGAISRRSNADQTEGLELVYGPRGELTRATVLATGDSISYEVDPLGRRVGRRVNGGTRKGWLYSDGLRIIAEINNNAARTDFIYGTRANVPDYMFKYGTTLFRLITDQLGSVRLVVNAETGEVVQELAYDAWGKVVLDTNPGFQPFGFAGGLYDPLTGLVRFGARDYDPEVGRWTNKDPVWFGGGQENLYVYCHNDPINFIDLTGLDPVEISAVGSGDFVNWAAAATRFGEIEMLDVKTMVDNVLTKAGTNKISRLNILDHGNPRGGYFGKDWLTPANLKYYEPILRRLKGKFTEGGIVHLQHCNIGQNRAFMRQLSAILGVDIVGGTGLHNPVYRFNWGDYVRCNRLVCGVTWRP